MRFTFSGPMQRPARFTAVIAPHQPGQAMERNGMAPSGLQKMTSPHRCAMPMLTKSRFRPKISSPPLRSDSGQARVAAPCAAKQEHCTAWTLSRNVCAMRISSYAMAAPSARPRISSRYGAGMCGSSRRPRRSSSARLSARKRRIIPMYSSKTR